MSTNQEHSLIAWEISPPADMELRPASGDRAWMDESDRRFAYRCLPLVIANQAGWIIPNPAEFGVCWTGGNQIEDLRLQFADGQVDRRVCSHFGHGVLTFTIPYLFRTPPGINLWVKGPANAIKDGIQPLEGIVETDWTAATFTMNWKLTRPDHTVHFQKGEPICMLVPAPRGLAEALDPVRRPLAHNPDLLHAFEHWREARLSFNDAIKQLDDAAVKRGWQRDYMHGHDGSGVPFPEHQTKLSLKEFRIESAEGNENETKMTNDDARMTRE